MNNPLSASETVNRNCPSSRQHDVVGRCALILLVVSCLLAPGIVWAGSCTATCNGGTCSASGPDAECWCHWFSGNPCCRGGSAIDQEHVETGPLDELTFFAPEQTYSFADRGGDFYALLETDLNEFFGAAIERIGYDKELQNVIQLMQQVKDAHSAGMNRKFHLELDNFESAVRDFDPAKREMLTDIALAFADGSWAE